MSFVSRPTFLKCQDFLDSWEQIFFSRSRFLKSRLFSRDFDALRFLLRLLRRFKIVKICQDVSRLLRFVKTHLRFVKKSQHCQSLLSLKMMKSLGLKNLDQEKKVNLDCWENFYTFKKLVSTLRTFLISISIGLDYWVPQAYVKHSKKLSKNK